MYGFIAELRARSAPAEHHGWINLPIPENLVITWPSDRATYRPSVRTTGIPMFTLTLSSYFGSPGESSLHINWQLSKQGIRWPASPGRIAGSGVDSSRSSIFELIRWQFTRFQMIAGSRLLFLKFISNMLCLRQYCTALLGSLRYGDYGLRLRINMLLRMIKTTWLFILPA